jgi:hypothetical protein
MKELTAYYYSGAYATTEIFTQSRKGSSSHKESIRVGANISNWSVFFEE